MNFYFEAAEILDRLDAKKCSIKSAIGSLPEKTRKRTAALVIETLKYKSVLTDVVRASNILHDERKKITSLNLALVLIHDILLCNGIQAGTGPIKQAVLRHKTRLSSEFQRIKVKRGVQSNDELAQSPGYQADRIPRYARVNTVKWSTNEAIQYFVSEGFILSGPFESRKGFAKDEHIPDLLAFTPQVQFQDDPSFMLGKIVLQDKASCFPAAVLAPPARDDCFVIGKDATAAPGNKTSHLSALMGNKGTLYAFERDRKRFLTLQTMLTKHGCRNVHPVHADFFTISPTDPTYSLVTHILLDPSCSGSGIINRLDYLLDTEDETSEERLDKLAGFQLNMIKHAMKFPSVRKIVYSTCSIHPTENEHVVCNALSSEEARDGGFKLASPVDILPTWQRRGLPEEMGTSNSLSVIRCLPGDDATNGFFVACFVKKEPNLVQGEKRKTPLHETEMTSGTTSRQKKKARRK